MYIPQTSDKEATRMFNEFLLAMRIDRDELRSEDFYLLKTTFFSGLAMMNLGIEIKAMKDECIKEYLQCIIGGVDRYFKRNIK